MLRTPKMYPPILGGIGPSLVKFWTTHTLSKERFFCHKIHEDECDRSEYNISRGENMKALQHWGCHNVSEIWVTAATLSSFLQYMLLSEDSMMIFSFGLMCSVCPFSYKWCGKMPKIRCDQFLHQTCLRNKNTALITSTMLNNLELFTSETQTNALHATFCATCIFWVFPHLQTLKAENASFSEQICCILLLHCTGKGVPSSILNPPMGNKVTEKIGLG